MNKRSVFFLSILLLLSGCAAHKVNVPALEFGGTEGDVSVLRLYFDGDSPVFLENGFTDLSARNDGYGDHLRVAAKLRPARQCDGHFDLQ